jgi:hypothetical protein
MKPEGGFWSNPSGGPVGEILCSARTCQRPLAEVRSKARIHVRVGPNDFGEHEDQPVDIGLATTLKPGFVNAKTRHPDAGVPWYVRHKSQPGRPSPAVKPPIVVTCRCGVDTLVQPTSQVQREYATAPRVRREDLMVDHLSEMSGEPFDEGR